MKGQSNQLQRLLGQTASRRWLFLGDSITQGAFHTHGWRDYTQIFGERLRNEMRRHSDLVLNAATDGATSTTCLANLGPVLASYKTDVSLLMIGTNDAARDRRISRRKFSSNLQGIVKKLRDAGSQVVLQTPNPIVPEIAAPYRQKFNGIVETIRSVAASETISLIDHENLWKTLFRKAPQSPVASYLCDGIHPNAFGHALLARHLFQALGIFDPTAPTCRGFLPHIDSLSQLQRQSKQ